MCITLKFFLYKKYAILLRKKEICDIKYHRIIIFVIGGTK